MRDTVGSLRMVGEGSSHRAGLVLLEILNLLEEGYKGLGIVAGAIHILNAKVVGLRLELTRKFEESHRNRDAGGFVNAVTSPPPDKDQGNGAQLGVVGAGHLAGGMVRADVG